MDERIQQLDHTGIIFIECGALGIILLQTLLPFRVFSVFSHLLKNLHLVKTGLKNYAASM